MIYQNLALKLCGRSNHKQHYHGAVVVVGGSIVAMGFNHDKTHAEVQALKKLWPDHRKGVKVYSFRFSKGGQWSMAKPCPKCEAFMRENGVKYVYYTTQTGSMERMRL